MSAPDASPLSAGEPRFTERRDGMVRRVTSAALFAGGRELIIEHDGEEYRLRRTSKGGLILTK